MKRTFLVAALVALVGVSLASAIDIPVTNCYVSVTNRVSTPYRLSGDIEQIKVVAPIAWTGTVVIATEYEQVIRMASISSTNVYRGPYIQPCFTNAAGLGSYTNTYDYVPYKLTEDLLTATITSTSTTTNTVTLKVCVE